MPNATATPTQPKPGLSDWIEVFRAGTHVDSAGHRVSFSVADLDQMVSNVSLGKPPAVLGHPKHDDPAYAWADLKREGESLFAKFEDINPAFEAGVRSGAYRNRSVSVLADKQHGWRVRHIGWLGAKPPAIDGLPPVQFSADDEAATHEFASGDPETDAAHMLAYGLEGAADLLRGFRDLLIEQSGVEKADTVLPAWRIEDLKSTAQRVHAVLNQPDQDDAPVTAFNAPEGGETTMALTQEDVDRARAEGRAEVEAQFAAQGQELAELRAERINNKVGTLVGEWLAKGLITPAEKPGLLAFMASLEDQVQQFSFASADGAEVKKAPAEFMASFMAGRKPLVQLGRDGRIEGDAPEMSDDPAVIANKARQFMAEQAALGVTVSLPDAVAKFSNPVA